jgi:hypothetical protein
MDLRSMKAGTYSSSMTIVDVDYTVSEYQSNRSHRNRNMYSVIRPHQSTLKTAFRHDRGVIRDLETAIH